MFDWQVRSYATFEKLHSALKVAFNISKVAFEEE